MKRNTAHLKPQEISVQCYSGHTYAERPVSFILNSDRYYVSSIEKEWIEPGKRYFRVITDTNKSFELCYNETDQKWTLTGQTGGNTDGQRNPENPRE
jgi:hypothetical protein